VIMTLTPNPLLELALDASEHFEGETRLDKIPMHVGGKSINVARMLKTLGTPATSLTFLGGFAGNIIKAKLREDGIFADHIETESETRIGVSIYENNPHKNRWWTENGSELREKEVCNMLELIGKYASKTSIMVISGTTPGIKNEDFCSRVLEKFSGQIPEIFLDIRGESLRKAMEIGGFFIKINREEALESFNLDPFLKNERKLLIENLKVHNVWGFLITDGAKSAILWDGSALYELVPPKTDLKSAVGCGDATMAGFIYGRKKGMSITESAILAMATGAADSEVAGPCMATEEQVKDKISQIKIYSMSQ